MSLHLADLGWANYPWACSYGSFAYHLGLPSRQTMGGWRDFPGMETEQALCTKHVNSHGCHIIMPVTYCSDTRLGAKLYGKTALKQQSFAEKPKHSHITLITW